MNKDEEWSSTLRVRLPSCFLNMPTPRNTLSWSVSPRQGDVAKRGAVTAFATGFKKACGMLAKSKDEDVVRIAKLAMGGKPKSSQEEASAVFIEIGHDSLGQRTYVSLGEALAAAAEAVAGKPSQGLLKKFFRSKHKVPKTGEEPEHKSEEGDPEDSKDSLLCLWTESEVKKTQSELPSRVLYAKFLLSGEGCKYNPYTVVQALSLGNHLFVLSEEPILVEENYRPGYTAQVRPLAIFGAIDTIVACHEAGVTASKYAVPVSHVESCAIHSLAKLMKRGGGDGFVEQELTRLNEAIWRGLQSGHVVVHCMAGHHVLRHSHVPATIGEAYKLLSGMRRGVQPLGYLHILEGWQTWLDVLLDLNPPPALGAVEAEPPSEGSGIVETI